MHYSIQVGGIWNECLGHAFYGWSQLCVWNDHPLRGSFIGVPVYQHHDGMSV